MYSLEFQQSVVPYVFIGLGLALLTVGVLLARLWMIGSGTAIFEAEVLLGTSRACFMRTGGRDPP
jgi:hypothetical protein